MSQRKDKKRKRESIEESLEPDLTSRVKRKRLEQVLDGLRSGKDGGQTEADVHVRRSGRTPKAKVFDDDYVTETVRAPESPKGAGFKSVQSSGSKLHDQVPKTNRTIKKEPVDAEIGHKRETRRSYQQYIEELASQSTVSEVNRGKSGTGRRNTPHEDATAAWDLKKVKKEKSTEPPDQAASVSQEASERSDNLSQHTLKQKERTPKETKKRQSGGMRRMEECNSGAVPSPKVRASSRTPVPKRTFPLLETTASQQVNEGELLNQEEASFVNVKVEAMEEAAEVSTQKVRNSTRTPVPKRSFSLFEVAANFHVKVENKDINMDNEDSPSSEARSISEASPARSSSRAPVPKRAFPLLAGESMQDKRKEKLSSSHKETGDSVGMSVTPEVSGTKKRKRCTSLRQVLAPGMAPVLSPTDSGQSGPKQKRGAVEKECSVKVTKKKPSKDISGGAAPKAKRNVKRKLSKKDSKTVISKQEAAGEDTIESEGLEISKSEGKPLLSKESATTPQKRSENSLQAKQTPAAMHVPESLVDVGSPSGPPKKAELKVKSEQKTKKHADKKHVHHHHSPKKSKKDFTEASSEVVEEEKHIILKLHLPHSSDHNSKSGSKKHKHKHSSESHDGALSPKKKHHKKSTEGALPVVEKPAAKKKISIKFKGLSTSHIDLEVEGASSGDSASKAPACKVKKEPEHEEKMSISSVVQALGTSLDSSGKKKKKTPQKRAPSGDHTSPKAEQLRKLAQKGKEISKAKNKQKEKSKSLTAGPKKKAAANTKSSPSKKKKADCTCPTCAHGTLNFTVTCDLPPQKPKLVTSYLLFCKHERSKIAKQFPGLEFSELSKKVGEIWNNLPDEEKQDWRDRADIANQRVRDLQTEAVSLQLDPIDLAAHLRLLGESLLTIGVCLGQQNEMEVHGSLSVLLDSALCAMSPLLFLTSQVPELNSCPKQVQSAVLDNLAYIMPGIG